MNTKNNIIALLLLVVLTTAVYTQESTTSTADLTSITAPCNIFNSILSTMLPQEQTYWISKFDSTATQDNGVACFKMPETDAEISEAKQIMNIYRDNLSADLTANSKKLRDSLSCMNEGFNSLNKESTSTGKKELPVTFDNIKNPFLETQATSNKCFAKAMTQFLNVSFERRGILGVPLNELSEFSESENGFLTYVFYDDATIKKLFKIFSESLPCASKFYNSLVDVLNKSQTMIRQMPLCSVDGSSNITKEETGTSASASASAIDDSTSVSAMDNTTSAPASGTRRLFKNYRLLQNSQSRCFPTGGNNFELNNNNNNNLNNVVPTADEIRQAENQAMDLLNNSNLADLQKQSMDLLNNDALKDLTKQAMDLQNSDAFKDLQNQSTGNLADAQKQLENLQNNDAFKDLTKQTMDLQNSNTNLADLTKQAMELQNSDALKDFQNQVMMNAMDNSVERNADGSCPEGYTGLEALSGITSLENNNQNFDFGSALDQLDNIQNNAQNIGSGLEDLPECSSKNNKKQCEVLIDQAKKILQAFQGFSEDVETSGEIPNQDDCVKERETFTKCTDEEEKQLDAGLKAFETQADQLKDNAGDLKDIQKVFEYKIAQLEDFNICDSFDNGRRNRVLQDNNNNNADLAQVTEALTDLAENGNVNEFLANNTMGANQAAMNANANAQMNANPNASFKDIDREFDFSKEFDNKKGDVNLGDCAIVFNEHYLPVLPMSTANRNKINSCKENFKNTFGDLYDAQSIEDATGPNSDNENEGGLHDFILEDYSVFENAGGDALSIRISENIQNINAAGANYLAVCEVSTGALTCTCKSGTCPALISGVNFSRSTDAYGTVKAARIVYWQINNVMGAFSEYKIDDAGYAENLVDYSCDAFSTGIAALERMSECNGIGKDKAKQEQCFGKMSDTCTDFIEEACSNTDFYEISESTKPIVKIPKVFTDENAADEAAYYLEELVFKTNGLIMRTNILLELSNLLAYLNEEETTTGRRLQNKSVKTSAKTMPSSFAVAVETVEVDRSTSTTKASATTYEQDLTSVTVSLNAKVGDNAPNNTNFVSLSIAFVFVVFGLLF